ncbi:MAG: polyribonucleotide nucleotidyltransferase [Candidatus Omnitrophota bacterium]|jgi:polyribonucleotide nucleotidyltransferase
MGTSLSLPNLGKNSLTFSTGDWAKQANGAVVLSYGETVVLATVCMSKEPKETDGFLPLTVEYQEKTYAMGKIPGGFIKREGRPKDEEILTSRLIDRPLRPLFPKGFTNEIQIVTMVLSSDGKNDPDIFAITAASSALFISNIPFYNPVGAVRVGKTEEGFILNPNYEEREKSLMDLVVVGTEDDIVMLEGGLKEISEAEVLEAIKFAQPFIREIVNFQKELRQKVGKKKKEVLMHEIDNALYGSLKDKIFKELEGVYGIVSKEEREEGVNKILALTCEELVKANPETDCGKVKEVFFALEEEFVRKKIVEENTRPDGRSLKEIRNIDCRVGVLPCTHGSATFTRGQTQSLSTTTLGTSSDEQFIEALEGKTTKRFMLHYSFPPFSVGEIKPLRGPSRRDIGHGALAEKALIPILPPKEVFPYTIRVVSEILESNGSSSMATVCASSLSLMDAGVPVKSPVAGIALGLITEGEEYKILTDIAGVEDHYGDMDFKVAGTKNGITAIQLDIKIGGLTYKMIEEALAQSKEARLFILEKMNASLSLPREIVSKYAPKIKSFKIDPDRIGAVIGPGGKFIRRLTSEYNVTIDIDDETATVSVVAMDLDNLERAAKQIQNMVKDIEVGEIFEGKVTRIANFGAFCEIVPGKQGLVHVSEISDSYVKDVNEVLKEGDVVKVKIIGIDSQGRINLSIKQAQ